MRYHIPVRTNILDIGQHAKVTRANHHRYMATQYTKNALTATWENDEPIPADPTVVFSRLAPDVASGNVLVEMMGGIMCGVLETLAAAGMVPLFKLGASIKSDTHGVLVCVDQSEWAVEWKDYPANKPQDGPHFARWTYDQCGTAFGVVWYSSWRDRWRAGYAMDSGYVPVEAYITSVASVGTV